jgi:VanZ family protein
VSRPDESRDGTGERLRRWGPVVVWAACISTFSTGWFTGERTGALLLPLFAVLFPDLDPAQLRAAHYAVRKVAHFTEYAILSVLLYRALREGPGWSARVAVTALVIAGLYAAADEFHQWFVVGRTASALDCLIDVTGAAAGQGLVAAGRRARA